MSSFKHLPTALNQALSKKSLLKVIAGLSNFDKESVLRIAKAANKGEADLLDIACDPDLVRLVIANTQLPVCVSAVDPTLFPDAVDAGASVIEIGNFDSFYPQGRFFDAAEVLALTHEARKLVPDITLSVTIPHILPLDQQSQLALDLVEAGANWIQTEGGTSAKPFSPGNLGLIEKAAPTLASAHTISQTFLNSGLKVPLLCASGLSEVTIPMALAVGASGVGVGSMVNRLSNDLQMLAVIRSLRQSIVGSHYFAENLV